MQVGVATLYAAHNGRCVGYNVKLMIEYYVGPKKHFWT